MIIKVCILTSVHSPFDTRIFHKEAKSLAKAGYDVTLIAQHDNDEIVNGIRIVPLPKPKNRFERMAKTIWATYRKALEINADIYHFHDPELIPIALLLKLQGKRIIYDVHEDVPCQILSKHYLPWIIRKPVALVMSAVEWSAAKWLCAIVAATAKISDRFPAEKTVIVQNYPIADELMLADPIPYAKRSQSFIYPGVIARIRGIEEIIRALEMLGDRPSVKFDVAGQFVPRGFADTLRAFPAWSSVNYHGEITRKELAHLMSGARAGLVLHHPVPNEIDAQPIKMFEYMAAGLPIIASNFRPLRKIINEEECGLIVDQSDSKVIAEAMRWILDHPAEAEVMGYNGRQAVKVKYNWNVEEKKLLRLYERIIDQRADA